MISILTDGPSFGGSTEDLMRARFNNLPILRKDFILDPYQLTESRAMGADVIEIALIAALKMYVEGSGNSISTEVVAPRSVRGHANHFLIAATLPLLQNAVDCAPTDTLVKCTVSSADSRHTIEVTNACPMKPDLRSMQHDGFTNKGAGHYGMGLKTARTLVRHLGGSLHFAYADKTVLAQIILGR